MEYERQNFLKDLENSEESSSEEDSNDEETSSEDEDENDDEESKQEDEPNSDSDSDDGTIGQIFQEIRNGCFDSDKKRKRFKQKQPRNEREVHTSASYRNEDDGVDVATRGDCVMETTEALHRLTRNEKDEVNEEDDWLIIKIPRKQKLKYFMVDYCDGDVEDEFHW